MPALGVSSRSLKSLTRILSMTDQVFRFDSDWGWTRTNFGLVFVGHARNGSASRGHRVSVVGAGGWFSGEIRAIESAQGPIDTTIPDEEIQIALHEISVEKVDELIYLPGYEDFGISSYNDTEQKAIFTEHGLIFPVVIGPTE
jgi:translation elongation factor EF-1alpha